MQQDHKFAGCTLGKIMCSCTKTELNVDTRHAVTINSLRQFCVVHSTCRSHAYIHNIYLSI